MRRRLTADFSLYFFRDWLRSPCFWWSCFKMRFLFPFSYPGPQTCVSLLELETHRKTWTAPNNFFKNTKESGKIFKPTTTGKDKIAVETLKSFSIGITRVIIYSKVFKHFIQNSWFNETLRLSLQTLRFRYGPKIHTLPSLPPPSRFGFFPHSDVRGVGQRRKFFTYLRCGSLSWVLRHSVLCVSCELTCCLGFFADLTS